MEQESSLANNQDLQKLFSSTYKFLMPLTVHETYKVVLDEAKKLVDAKYCSVFLKKRGRLERVYATSPKLFKINIRKNGYTHRAFTSKKSVVVPISKIEKFHPQVKDMGIKSTIYIPLVYKNDCVGVLSADSFHSQDFGKKELKILTFFGRLAILAIRKAQLHDELQESLRTRDLFISMASHELRSPLTTINSYVQLLQKTIAGDKKIDKKWIQILSSETTRIILMVNELLQLDQIKTGKLQYNWKTCDLRKILERIIINFKAKFPNRKLNYKYHVKTPNPNVMADFDKIIQVVTNILDNAAKFSEQNTPIFLSLNYSKPYFVISIRDKGAGIEAGDKKKVFQGFYKGRNSTKKGIGLGLYLAKSIIKIHGGKIHLKSEPGKGTVMSIFLPTLND